jgi:hypothetical protein
MASLPQRTTALPVNPLHVLEWDRTVSLTTPRAMGTHIDIQSRALLDMLADKPQACRRGKSPQNLLRNHAS